MKKIFNLALALVLIVALVVACNQPTPTPGPSRGVTNYDALSVAAGTAAAPSFYFGTDSDTGFYWSSANVIGLAAAGSSVATFSASAYAPVGALNLTQVNAASGSANPLDYTGSLGIMNGSDDFTAIDINITNANHTSTGNTVQAIDIAAITGDAEATETAINVGSGWDSGLTVASPATFSDAVTFASTIASTLVNAASGSANPFDWTGTLGIMNGSDDFTLFDVNITNADHTGSNTIQVLDVANITGDAEATENAIQVGTGWDLGLNLNSPANLNAQIISNIGNAGTDFLANGGLTLANALTVSSGGATVSAGNLAVSAGTMAGPAEGNVVVNTLHNVTAAELNAGGHTLVTVPAALSLRLVDATAIAYGGSCSANITTVNISTTSATLITYGQAQLVQSTPLVIPGTGVTILADGASFSAMAAGEDLIAVGVGTAVDTCTGVRFIISYVLQ